MRAFASLRSMIASSSRASSGAVRARDHQVEILRLREQLEGGEQAVHALVAPDHPEAQDDAGLLRDVEAAATGRAGVHGMLRDEALEVSQRGEHQLPLRHAELGDQTLARGARKDVDAVDQAIPALEERLVPAGGLVRHGVVRGDDEIAQPGPQQEVERRLAERDAERLHVDGIAAVAPELDAEPQRPPQLLRQLAKPAARPAEGRQHLQQPLAVAGLEARILDGHDAEPRVARERPHQQHAVGVAAGEALDQEHARARIHRAPQPGSRPWARSCDSIQR